MAVEVEDYLQEEMELLLEQEMLKLLPVEGAEAAREALCSAALALALAFFAGPLRC